jgi:hypothetical protein
MRPATCRHRWQTLNLTNQGKKATMEPDQTPFEETKKAAGIDPAACTEGIPIAEADAALLLPVRLQLTIISTTWSRADTTNRPASSSSTRLTNGAET